MVAVFRTEYLPPYFGGEAVPSGKMILVFGRAALSSRRAEAGILMEPLSLSQFRAVSDFRPSTSFREVQPIRRRSVRSVRLLSTPTLCSRGQTSRDSVFMLVRPFRLSTFCRIGQWPMPRLRREVSPFNTSIFCITAQFQMLSECRLVRLCRASTFFKVGQLRIQRTCRLVSPFRASTLSHPSICKAVGRRRWIKSR